MNKILVIIPLFLIMSSCEAVNELLNPSDVVNTIVLLPGLPAPVCRPPGGSYTNTGPFNVSITCVTNGAEINWSTNGGGSWNIGSAVVIFHSSTLLARARMTGFNDSAVSTNVYLFFGITNYQLVSGFSNRTATNWQYSGPFDLTNDISVTNYAISNGIYTNIASGVYNAYTDSIFLFTVTNTVSNEIVFPATNMAGAYTIGSIWFQATNKAGFLQRDSHTSIVFNGCIWVIGGYTSPYATNDVWYSPDGTNWFCATNNAQLTNRYCHTSVVYKGRMWVIGGTDGSVSFKDVWYSSDGTNWFCATNNAPFGARDSHTSVVFNGNMWVIGGNSGSLNDVWYSSDGTNWYCATNNGQFTTRSSHTSVVYNGCMWVIGGYSTTVYDNISSVWYSSDGTNWFCATNNAPFIERDIHTSVVFNNRMWVIGGKTAGPCNDVWYSSDGTNWYCATNNGQFTNRDSHTSVVFNDRMWVIGGHIYSSISTNDVWYSK